MTSTKEHILFTAFKLILKKGYGNVTMSELVTSTGLSKGAFYHYFTSKDQIYQTAMDQYVFSYLESFDLVYQADKSFQDNLFGIFSQFIEMAKEIDQLIGPENHMINYYQTVLEGSIRSIEIKKKITRYYELYIDGLAEWIRWAQGKNEIRDDLDPVVLGKHLCSLMEGIMIVYSFQTREDDLETYFNEIFYQFFELIKKTALNEKD